MKRYALTVLTLLGLSLHSVSQAASSWRGIVVSAYTPTKSQTDSTPHITATGTKVRYGIVALSRDLLNVYPYGSKVEIYCQSNNFRGVFTVEDTMNKSKWNKADIFMWSYNSAINWGVRTCKIRSLSN